MTMMTMQCKSLFFFIGFFIVWLIVMASLFLAGKYGCCHKPTQTGANILILCRQHRPIWPKLEQHLVSGRTVANMLVTFPAKVVLPPACLLSSPSHPLVVLSTTLSCLNMSVPLLSWSHPLPCPCMATLPLPCHRVLLLPLPALVEPFSARSHCCQLKDLSAAIVATTFSLPMNKDIHLCKKAMAFAVAEAPLLA
jgi:hypothetical protein